MLIINPIGAPKLTEQERRESYAYACANLHRVPDPRASLNWELFTADPTNRDAMVYSIARPGHGAESCSFGTLADTARMLDHLASLYDRDAHFSDDGAEYYAAHEWPELAAKRREEAKEQRRRAQEHRDAADRIRSQWTPKGRR